jgi:hypothetical protein
MIMPNHADKHDDLKVADRIQQKIFTVIHGEPSGPLLDALIYLTALVVLGLHVSDAERQEALDAVIEKLREFVAYALEKRMAEEARLRGEARH